MPKSYRYEESMSENPVCFDCGEIMEYVRTESSFLLNGKFMDIDIFRCENCGISHLEYTESGHDLADGEDIWDEKDLFDDSL
jgi:hypothetical protein